MNRGRKKGVNPVISSLLIISMAVAAAAISYVYVMSYSQPQPGPVEIVQIDNIIWSAPNKIVATLSNHGQVKRVVEIAYIEGNRGFPSAPVEISPGEMKDVEFTFEDDIQPGEHLVKVVCQDGTMGVIAHRFSGFFATTTTATTPTTSPTTTTTTTTATSPCLVIQAYYDQERSKVLPAIRAVQSFRDNVMASSPVGLQLIRIFNAAYYPLSRLITPLILKHPILGLMVRVTFSPAMAVALVSIKVGELLALSGELKVLSSLLIGSALLGAVYLPLPLSALSRKNLDGIFRALRNLAFSSFIFTLILEMLSIDELASALLAVSAISLAFLAALTILAKVQRWKA